MVTRFVYPKLNLFLEARGIPAARQLQISSEDSDGYCWFGIRTGIESYLKESGLSIDKIVWKIKVVPKNTGYAEIRAKSIDDWLNQFNRLGVVFEEYGDD